MAVLSPSIAATSKARTVPPLLHSYPREARYRLSGADGPQIGDIALCGHVKATPPKPENWNRPATCVVCAGLEGAYA